MMRYASVCSGIEAATQAWHPLGFKPVWFSQYDPENNYLKDIDFPSKVLKHHYPDVPNLGDMTKLSQNDFYKCPKQPQISTSLSEERHARLSVLPASERDYVMSVLTSPLNLSEYLLKNVPPGSSGRMCRGCLLQEQMKPKKEMKKKADQVPTSLALFQPSPEEISQTKPSKKKASSKVNFTLSHGAYLIAGGSECHKDAAASLLSDILEKTGDHLLRYSLSPTACEGILRRAQRRGKELPQILQQALTEIANGGV